MLYIIARTLDEAEQLVTSGSYRRYMGGPFSPNYNQGLTVEQAQRNLANIHALSIPEAKDYKIFSVLLTVVPGLLTRK